VHAQVVHASTKHTLQDLQDISGCGKLSLPFFYLHLWYPFTGHSRASGGNSWATHLRHCLSSSMGVWSR